MFRTIGLTVVACAAFPLVTVGLPAPIRIPVDQGVFDEEEISIGSGVRSTVVILKSADLHRASGEVETGCFVEG